MTKTSKILLLCLALAFSYLGYAAWQFNEEINSIYEVEDKYAVGSKNASITIVSFQKFGCNHCQELHPIILEAVKRDGDVRYVPRIVTFELIWDETLVAAVYAAAEQGRFIEYQKEIYKNWPVRDHEKLFLIASKVGIDTEQLTRDMADPAIRQRAQEDHLYFIALQLARTPTLLMNKKAIYIPDENIPSVEELLEMFDRVR